MTRRLLTAALTAAVIGVVTASNALALTWNWTG